MPPEFDRPHLDISDKAQPGRYQSPTQNIGEGRAPRIREEHGAMLRDQLRAAFREDRQAREEADIPEGFERVDGAYYEVELSKGAKAEKLERKRDHVSVGATKIDPDTDRVSTVVFVPDESVEVLDRIFDDYATGDLSPKGKPQRQDYVEPIEVIRRARLFSFWTDDRNALPEGAQDRIWWEIWCAPDCVAQVADTFHRMDCLVANEDRWLRFPETTVFPVLARRADIELSLILAEGITELRRGSDTPAFYIEEERDNQYDWAADLAERTVWPGNDVPRVCLLDTGVNRAHVLIEPALAEADLQTVNADWGATDNIGRSHGTEMAGLALHGDLFARLQDGNQYALDHRLESVRILPADGFPANEPARYGSITLSAVALAEIRNPENQRVFCMAITNEDRSGDRASTWSACVDRSAAGAGIADNGDDADRRRRLFCISGGNVRNAMQADRLGRVNDYPIEDPAQAWNALTIGGYTEKTQIDADDLHFAGHQPMMEAGDVSPFSRNSVSWRSSKTPIKPDVVFEAGNRAIAGNGRDLVDCPSLELLTTGANVDQLPIVNFAATSAATAQAARLAAQLQADHPGYWPETIRALIVHSAEWAAPMKGRLVNANNARERKALLRTFGYGVPSYRRATRSATDNLALVAQKEIQPYRRSQSGAVFNQCHYYPLPWPARTLEEYHDQEFRLKLTLSYFVEPNPGKSAAIDPQRYQSFGLRFDLKRPLETTDQFKKRNNASEREDPRRAGQPAVQDDGWILGPNGISAGALHCDVWRGTGARLAARNMICIKPVSGWWKERRNPDICEQRARYALIVTLTAPEAEIDLYTPISVLIEQPVEIDIQ